jgi:hypothetical protein
MILEKKLIFEMVEVRNLLIKLKIDEIWKKANCYIITTMLR